MIRVTVEDPETGDKETKQIHDDYVVIADGRVYVADVRVHSNGTHVITVKRRSDVPPVRS